MIHDRPDRREFLAAAAGLLPALALAGDAGRLLRRASSPTDASAALPPRVVGLRSLEDILLHGDTGNEAPVMPAVYNYFATWGPSRIFVNGEEVIPMIGSHTMFSEQARNEASRIVNDEGEVYSPMVQDKTGFTNPHETEFHYVAHTTEPDQNNFPPHTGWIHLHFDDVEVIQKPGDVEIPHVAESMD